MKQLTVYSGAWSLTGAVREGGGCWQRRGEKKGGGWRVCCSSPSTEQLSQFLLLEWGYPKGLSKLVVPQANVAVGRRGLGMWGRWSCVCVGTCNRQKCMCVKEETHGNLYISWLPDPAHVNVCHFQSKVIPAVLSSVLLSWTPNAAFVPNTGFRLPSTG